MKTVAIVGIVFGVLYLGASVFLPENTVRAISGVLGALYAWIGIRKLVRMKRIDDAVNR